MRVVDVSNNSIAAPSSLVERATDHTIRFETWVGYNSTWKHFKVRALTTSKCFLLLSTRLLSSGRASLLAADVGGREQRVVYDGEGEDRWR